MPDLESGPYDFYAISVRDVNPDSNLLPQRCPMLETIIGTVIYGLVFYVCFLGRIFDVGGFGESKK